MLITSSSKQYIDLCACVCLIDRSLIFTYHGCCYIEFVIVVKVLDVSNFPSIYILNQGKENILSRFLWVRVSKCIVMQLYSNNPSLFYMSVLNWSAILGCIKTSHVSLPNNTYTKLLLRIWFVLNVKSNSEWPNFIRNTVLFI